MIVLIIASSLASLALVLALLYLLILVRPRKKIRPRDALLCDYAHRGLHGNGIPENSLAAFEKACEAGYGIELDVQLSRDGVVMVFHDYTLVCMTGCDKRLCELDAEELTSLFLDSSDQTIPTFAQVLSLVDGRVPILVELKGEDLNTALCEKVAAQLKDYSGEYCLESFNPLLIGNIRKHLPDALRGLLYTNVCRDKKKSSALNIALTAMALNVVAKPDFIAYNKTDRDSLPVKLTTGLWGAPKFVWTVRSLEELEDAHKRGESPIFENCN
ncbi:MAG: glycerophosphodiester phosphodiesterase [Clostridia bacterium]|nr:glycerophosphodiester phosphodiesterase [Clostridia bacterium]